jgi:hypothetical protein
MTNVLSFDPGETTGWAYQDERDDFPGGIIDLGQIKGLEELAKFLENFTRPVDHVTIEDYVVWGGKRGGQSNTGSKLETVRAIGVIESWCFRKGIKFTKYTSDKITLFAKHTGLNPTNGAHKNTHWAYAAVYGRKYLQDHHGAKSALQRAMKK